MLVSRTEFSDLSHTYNTQCSLQVFLILVYFLNRRNPQENEMEQNVQKQYNHKKEFSCHDTYPSQEKKKIDVSFLTNEAPPCSLQWETNDVHLEAEDFQPQKEVVATASPKTTTILPQMGSSPDVIIEEIIEENLESE